MKSRKLHRFERSRLGLYLDWSVLYCLVWKMVLIFCLPIFSRSWGEIFSNFLKSLRYRCKQILQQNDFFKRLETQSYSLPNMYRSLTKSQFSPKMMKKWYEHAVFYLGFWKVQGAAPSFQKPGGGATFSKNLLVYYRKRCFCLYDALLALFFCCFCACLERFYFFLPLFMP